jgi:hypothetical protein
MNKRLKRVALPWLGNWAGLPGSMSHLFSRRFADRRNTGDLRSLFFVNNTEIMI